MSPDEMRLLLAPPIVESRLIEEDADEIEQDAESAPLEKPLTDAAPKSADASASSRDDDHIHDDEEGERAANAARGVS